MILMQEQRTPWVAIMSIDCCLRMAETEVKKIGATVGMTNDLDSGRLTSQENISYGW